MRAFCILSRCWYVDFWPYQVIDILDKLKKERMNAEGKDDDQYDSDLPDDDSDWDDDDPEDEGIIYVK